MSRFFSKRYAVLTPYTPGEQPRDKKYIKLNTNESPFPPSSKAIELARKAAENLQLYSDPQCRDLVREGAKYFEVDEDEIIFTNGSDEILNFAFMAFCDEDHPAIFPDVTYGFYSVFAQLNTIPYKEIPLREDFTVDTEPYVGSKETVFLANPNAQTGISLPLSEIEKIVASNPERVVVIDEAYVDFGGETALPLIQRYDNLLVIQTMSKSRSLAGGRLGFGIGQKSLIEDINTIKYSTNPYNINRMSQAAAIGALKDEEYFINNCRAIVENRKMTVEALEAMDFTILPSKANFVLAKHKTFSGLLLYEKLKKRGILVRHFETERLKEYNRITIGNKSQMEELIMQIKNVLEE